MNGAIIMLAAAAAGQLPACPPVSQLSKSTPVALRVQRRMPDMLQQWSIKLAKGDVVAATSYLVVDGVPTTFLVIRPSSMPGTTRLFAVCAAPWGEMMCARDFFDSTGKSPAPDVFVRRQGERTFLVIRYQETKGRRYEVKILDQLSGLKKVCG